MAAIGYLLRQTRKKLGYSIEKMSEITHINTVYLRSLENDHPESIPPIYRKAYVQTYAKLLGFDPQSFMRYCERGNEVIKGESSALPEMTCGERCNRSNTALSPRRVAMRMKQDRLKKRFQLKRYIWPVGVVAVIGSMLWVVGGLYFSNGNQHTENQASTQVEELPLVANAATNQGPFLEVGELSDDPRLGQLYSIHNVANLKVEIKGKKGNLLCFTVNRQMNSRISF